MRPVNLALASHSQRACFFVVGDGGGLAHGIVVEVLARDASDFRRRGNVKDDGGALFGAVAEALPRAEPGVVGPAHVVVEELCCNDARVEAVGP